MARLALAFPIAILAACSGSRPRTEGDAAGGTTGAGGQGGTGGDGQGGGGGGGPVGCTPGGFACDGDMVIMCDDKGLPGPPVAACAEACSAGRCTTAACAEGEAKRSVVGCLFYGVDTDNTQWDDPGIHGFPVGNPGTAPARVVLQKSIGKDSWTDEITTMVPAGEVSYLRLATGVAVGKDYHIEGTGRDFRGWRIVAESPVVAYQIQADDEQGESTSSGSTLLLPAHVLGRTHFAITPPERGITADPPGAYGPDKAFITIVGTRNGTDVKIALAGSVAAGGAVPAVGKGETYSVALDEGEVLQLESGGAGQDFSGSEVTSNQPVAVFAGNACGGFAADRPPMCDHIEEQMYPTTTWGRSFVFLDMRMPEADIGTKPSTEIWGRIVASEDATTLTFETPRPLAGVPATPVTLKRGEVYALAVADPFAIDRRAHFRVVSDRPVQVESFMGTEEGGAIVIPVDQFLDDYLVSAHWWFSGHLLVTRTIGTPVTLDGVAMPDTAFLPGGGGFEVSFVALERCDQMPAKCGHRIQGARVGVTITAAGGACNYCYAGGAGARCVNATAGCL